jgi:hypothetical protein
VSRRDDRASNGPADRLSARSGAFLVGRCAERPELPADRRSLHVHPSRTRGHLLRRHPARALAEVGGVRAVVALAIESAWELYENTDAVIERYRTETISLGYYGDSIINSVADIVACAIGFVLAWRLPKSATIAWVATIEVLLVLWIRDNLALNILMLLSPIDAIRTWQMGA